MHFVDPIVAREGSYVAPSEPGYSGEMKAESLMEYEYPSGSVWQTLLQNTN